MKKIKIFLASSEELQEERTVMEALFNRLNKLFKGRGLELDLEIWEYLDASMTDKRKQDEYNDVLKQCDICIVLFWRKFGCYTGEELDTAYQRMRQKEKPYKIYVFFKNPNSDEITPELKDFIANYEKRYGGHFFSKFEHVDTMKLEFLLQLENYQKELIGESAIEVRNEHVYVNNEEFVDLNNIPFAAKNEGFLKKKSELTHLREEIEKKQQELEKKKNKLERRREKLEKDPDDEDYQEDFKEAKEDVKDVTDSLQELLDKKNKLEEEFEREQQNLFNTARRITELRGVNISQRMTRAIEAFEAGDTKRADTILDEAEKDADQALEDIQVAKKVGLQSLEELILKTSVKMANDTIPIDDRVAETQKIYEKAVKLAKEAEYDDVKYADLIGEYGDFLLEYGKYEEALNYRKELLTLRKKIYGNESIEVAWVLCILGSNFEKVDNLDDALNNLKEAERIITQSNGKDVICESNIYNNLGIVLHDLDENDDAINYHKKSLAIREKVFGEYSPAVACSLNNLGIILHSQNDYEDSLKYHRKALKIEETTLGKKHRNTAGSYHNIGGALCDIGDFAEAIKYCKIAISIYEEVLGINHPNTLNCYYRIGKIYFKMKEYCPMAEWFSKAAEQGYARAQCDLGWLYENGYGVEQDYHKAAGWYLKAAEQNNDTAQCNLAWLYTRGKGVEQDYYKAAEWYLKAAEQGYARAQYSLAVLYRDGKEVEQDYNKAVEWYLKAAEQGYEHSYNELAWTYHLMGKYEEALPWAEKAIAAFPSDSNITDTLATVYQGLGRYEEALQQFKQCLELQKEQQLPEENIQETETKIAQLKKLTEQQNK